MEIAVPLYPRFTALDAVGPYEVLAYWTRHHPEDGWSVTCVPSRQTSCTHTRSA